MAEKLDGFQPALVWRSLALRLALIAIPFWFTLAVLVFATPWRLKLLVGGIAALSAAAPAAGLAAVALLTPFGLLLTAAIGLEPFRLSEAFVLAFLCGWVPRAAADRPGPRVAGVAGWLLAASIVASVAIEIWQMGHVQPYRGELKDTFELLFYGYYFSADRVGFIAGAKMLEGIALVAATVTIFRQHPRAAATLTAALVLAAAAAGVCGVLLWNGIAPPAVLARYQQIGYRVSAHVADVNAAGSYLAMALCLATGAAYRARGRSAFWIAMVACCATGLWISRSRSAIVAAIVALALAIGWTATARLGRRARVAALAALVLIGLAGGAARADLFGRRPNVFGADMRRQFNDTSLRMLRAQPLSGVGVGQYYRHSSLFLPASLSWTYGYENAHNYFLQVAAELGIPGLTAFIIWLGAAVGSALLALRLAPGDARLAGATGGVVAFLATCFVGHPLLVDEVAFPFWIQVGLMIGLAGSVLRGAAPTEAIAKAEAPTPLALSVAAAVVAMVMLVAVPVGAARAAVVPPSSAAVDGLYEWETAGDGTRFRWMGEYGSLFVPAAVTRVIIPVRMPANIPGVTPLAVEVMTMRVPGGRSFIGSSWAELNIKLPDVEPPTFYKRIDLRVDRTWQPAVYLPGSNDLRSLGLQVGELKLLREY